MSSDLDPIEEKIIQYVKDNPGKSKSDVVRFLKDRHIAARIATLTHLDKLENKKMIICELENPNSQIYRIYINKNNKLVSVLVELEEFKAAYFDLLEKSKEKINNKDYSADAKALGIKEIDPAKWSKADRLRYFDLKSTGLNKYEDEKKKIKNQLSLSLSSYSDSIRDDSQKEEDLQIWRLLTREADRRGLGKGVTGNNKEIEMKRSDAIKIKNLIDKWIHRTYDVESYDVIFLTIYPINIFFVFTDIMFLRNIFAWPNNINNKDILSQIYASVNRVISEIQKQLSEYFNTIKLSIVHSDLVKNIAQPFTNISRDPNYSLIGVDCYQVFGMKSEIHLVINSLRKLSEEIKDYYYLYPNEIFLIDYHQKSKEEITKLLKHQD